MEIPFPAWVLQGIPESIGCAALIVSMGSKEMLWKKIIMIGLIQAVFIYIIRLLPLTPYSHTFLIIPLSAFIVSLFTALDIRLTHLFAVLAILTIAVSEMCFYYLFNALEIISFEAVFTSNTSRIISGMPQVLVLFILAWLINRIKKRLAINNWRFDSGKGEGYYGGNENSGNTRNI